MWAIPRTPGLNPKEARGCPCRNGEWWWPRTTSHGDFKKLQIPEKKWLHGVPREMQHYIISQSLPDSGMAWEQLRNLCACVEALRNRGNLDRGKVNQRCWKNPRKPSGGHTAHVNRGVFPVLRPKWTLQISQWWGWGTLRWFSVFIALIFYFWNYPQKHFSLLYLIKDTASKV